MAFNLNATNNLPSSSTSSCTDDFFDGCHSKNQNNCQSQFQDYQCRPCCVNPMINDHTYSLLKKICRKVIRDYHRQQTREKYTIFDGGNSITVRIHRSSFVPGEDGKCKPILGNQRQNNGKNKYRKKDKSNGRSKNKGRNDDDDEDTRAKTNGWKIKAQKSDLNGYKNSGVRGNKRKRRKGEDDVNEGQGKGKGKGGDDDDSGKRKIIQVRGMKNDDNGGSSKREKRRKEKRKGDDQDSSIKQGKRKGSEFNDDGKVNRAKGKRGRGITYGDNGQDKDVGASRNTRSEGENIESPDNKRNDDKVGKVKSANNRKNDGNGNNDDIFDFKVGNKKSEKGKQRSSEANDDGKHGKGKLGKSGAKHLENGETNDQNKSDEANRKNYKQGITDLPVISDLRTKVRKGYVIIPNRKTLKIKDNYQSSSFQEDGRKMRDRYSFSVHKHKQKQLSKSRKDHISERFGSKTSRQKFRSSRCKGRVNRGYGPWMPSRYDEIRPCDILRAHMEQRELCERQRCCLPSPFNCNTIYCQAPSTICSGLY